MLTVYAKPTTSGSIAVNSPGFNVQMHVFTFVSRCLAFLLVVSSTAWGAEMGVPNPTAILRTYAHSIGCGFSIDRRNVVSYDIEGDGTQELVVLFTLDPGCSGGSGSFAPYLAVLDQAMDAAGKPRTYVRAELSEPGVPRYGLPRFIDSIFVKDGHLWFKGRIHAPRDGNNFPSIPVHAELRLLKGEIPVGTNAKVTTYYWASSENFQDR